MGKDNLFAKGKLLVTVHSVSVTAFGYKFHKIWKIH